MFNGYCLSYSERPAAVRAISRRPYGALSRDIDQRRAFNQTIQVLEHAQSRFLISPDLGGQRTVQIQFRSTGQADKEGYTRGTRQNGLEEVEDKAIEKTLTC
jgi:hypothetical protein